MSIGYATRIRHKISMTVTKILNITKRKKISLRCIKLKA